MEPDFEMPSSSEDPGATTSAGCRRSRPQVVQVQHGALGPVVSQQIQVHK